MYYDIHEILKNAVLDKASDVHITVDSPPIRRIDGKLQAYGDVSLTGEDTEKMAKTLLSDVDWQSFLEKGEVDASYAISEVARFRLNIYRQKQSVTFVARIIPDTIPTIQELNMPNVLEKLARKPHGLILVTGPTGSGKSTTLAAMIDFINKQEAKHIITLEDPIEYVHHHQKSMVHQREIGSDTEKFANGLRAALRQDPDIILVGEMRDLETISTAITAAETGHLVLATLHTNSAAQTINRIIDVFPPHQQAQIRIQLADVLEGIISQRLFPRTGGNGRIAATEILINLPSIGNLIRSEKISQIQNVMQTSRIQGMHTLEMSIRDLLQTGMIEMRAAAAYLNHVGDV